MSTIAEQGARDVRTKSKQMSGDAAGESRVAACPPLPSVSMCVCAPVTEWPFVLSAGQSGACRWSAQASLPAPTLGFALFLRRPRKGRVDLRSR